MCRVLLDYASRSIPSSSSVSFFSGFYLQGMPGFSGPPGVQGADGELVIIHFYVQLLQASSRFRL